MIYTERYLVRVEMGDFAREFMHGDIVFVNCVDFHCTEKLEDPDCRSG